jgi:hypothetical protein
MARRGASLFISSHRYFFFDVYICYISFALALLGCRIRFRGELVSSRRRCCRPPPLSSSRRFRRSITDFVRRRALR